MEIAAVVVNWNSGEALERCLKPLAGLHDVVVVDNASVDDSLDRAARSCTNVKFLRNPDNRGFAAGVNQGVGTTHADFVLILNPDVEAEPGAIGRLAQFLDQNPRAGAVGANVNPQYLPRRLPTPWSLALENLGIRRDAMHPDDTEVEQAAAAALLIRRVAHDAIGGFDERFFPAWYEDVDYCKRLREAGWTVHFLATVCFEHEGGYSAKTLGRASFLSAFYRNQLRYARKHFGGPGAALVRGSIAVGMVGRMIADPSHAGAYARVIAGAAGAW